MEQFKRATGVNIVGVPYKARGADLPDAIIKSETAKWAKVVKDARVSVQ